MLWIAGWLWSQCKGNWPHLKLILGPPSNFAFLGWHQCSSGLVARTLKWFAIPFSRDHILSGLPTWPDHLGWPHMAWPSFIELDNAVIQFRLMLDQIFLKQIFTTLHYFSKTEGLENCQLPERSIPTIHSWCGKMTPRVVVLNSKGPMGRWI